MTLPRRLFVANRGEIAVRIMRTCRALGIQTVWPRIPQEEKSLASNLANHIVELEQATDYLDGEKLVALACDLKCEAVHPGYGYLSENIEFARLVRQSGLIFVGPEEEALRVMGDKLTSRHHMQQAGVPVVPGTEEISDLDRALEEVGLPALLKPSGGGGGKGMVVVEKAEDLADSLAACRRQAQKAFANDQVYMERWIPRARHIEVQIMADSHGTVWAYGTRDCTVQRRYQKIIEECPAPNISESLQKEFEEAAIRAAQAVNYLGAGTVEFILTPEDEFYFLEMNTRLQVEHPVTELVWGVDLVEQQIRVASGEKLEGSFQARGHAIEARIYAEDSDFLPCTGKIHLLKFPEGPGIRVDSGVQLSSEVGIHFDPMIAKISTWGHSRDQAIRRLVDALNEFVLHGVGHNGHFLLKILNHADFQNCSVWTRWIADQNIRGDAANPQAPFWLLLAQAQKTSSASSRATKNAAQRVSEFASGDSFSFGGQS